MARYINESILVKKLLEERDKIPLKIPGALYELVKEKPNHFGNAMRGGIKKALRCVYETPTANVVEVRHGEWISRKEIFSEIEGEVDAIGCSECNKSQRVYRRTPYCPNCGALMDGKRKDGVDNE